MRRESHVRFCEGGGVRVPSATRRRHPSHSTPAEGLNQGLNQGATRDPRQMESA